MFSESQQSSVNRDSGSTSSAEAASRPSSFVPRDYSLVDHRVLQLCLVAIFLGVVAAFVAQLLIMLIAFITNVAYYGDFSLQARDPANAIGRLGLWSVPIPVIGAILIGLMARFSSKAIRGHGIPEAMEQVLTNESRIPSRIAFLKRVSAAISIGTGGPFGAEGPKFKEFSHLIFINLRRKIPCFGLDAFKPAIVGAAVQKIAF